MSVQAETQHRLAVALADNNAAIDLVNAINTGVSGTVTSVSVVTAHGVSGSVATQTTTPAITLTLGAITPTTIVNSGDITSAGNVKLASGKAFYVNSVQVVSAQQAASVPIAVTFTAGGTPAVYTTPTGALTIAHSDVPTAVELLAYCNELRGNILQLQAILTAHGLST